MILLFNVCITPSTSSCNINYDRGILPSFDKIDILKYSLSSLSVIPWSEAIINIENFGLEMIFLQKELPENPVFKGEVNYPKKRFFWIFDPPINFLIFFAKIHFARKFNFFYYRSNSQQEVIFSHFWKISIILPEI